MVVDIVRYNERSWDHINHLIIIINLNYLIPSMASLPRCLPSNLIFIYIIISSIYHLTISYLSHNLPSHNLPSHNLPCLSPEWGGHHSNCQNTLTNKIRGHRRWWDRYLILIITLFRQCWAITLAAPVPSLWWDVIYVIFKLISIFKSSHHL